MSTRNSTLTHHRTISIVDFIEVYSYGTLLIVFAYIIAIAVIGMAYGSKKARERDESLDGDSFYVAYMTSIMVIPVSTTILGLQLKNKVTQQPSTQPPLIIEKQFLSRAPGQ